MKNTFFTFALLLALGYLVSCTPPQPPLKVYGRINAFSFIDQDSLVVDTNTVHNKLYLADFFFTKCPTICPKVKRQMLRVYNEFSDEPRLVMLSHSIDYKYDTVATLKQYAQKLKVETNRWHFLTGNKDSIYGIAYKYMVNALEDKEAEGGYTHSGKIILIDKKRQIRGFYEGTDEADVNNLIRDIKILLKTEF